MSMGMDTSMEMDVEMEMENEMAEGVDTSMDVRR